MNKFNIGDRVRVLHLTGALDAQKAGVKVGDVLTVTCRSQTSGGTGIYWFNSYEKKFALNEDRLSVAHPNPPHKHAEVIKAWADGAEVEWRNKPSHQWRQAVHPTFVATSEYRIKPQPSKKELEIERIETEMRKLADDLKAIKDE